MNNDVFPNKFKAALAAKQVQIGCWSALSNPISTEVLGLAGFDWLVLDGEHAPNDICIQKTQKCIHSMILLFISQSAHKYLPTRQNFVMNAVLAWLQF